MEISTDTIPYMDFIKSPELLSLVTQVTQYELGEYEIARGTDHEILPFEKGIADIKADLEGKILMKTPQTFPTSFFINRLHAVVINETSRFIGPDAIAQLQNYLKPKESANRITDVKLSYNETEFCERHGVLQYIPVAIDISKRSFSNIQNIYPEILQDQDTGEQWLVINVEVKGEIDDILNMYDKYTGEWVSRVPWPQREKINLSYIII